MKTVVDNYLDFINETVKLQKQYLEKHELLHYMIGDTNNINATKVEKDKLTREQVYRISTYSAFREIQDSLKELDEEGEVRVLKMATPDEEDELDIDSLLSNKKVRVTGVDNIPLKHRKEMLDALSEIVKDLEKKVNKKKKDEE